MFNWNNKINTQNKKNIINALSLPHGSRGNNLKPKQSKNRLLYPLTYKYTMTQVGFINNKIKEFEVKNQIEIGKTPNIGEVAQKIVASSFQTEFGAQYIIETFTRGEPNTTSICLSKYNGNYDKKEKNRTIERFKQLTSLNIQIPDKNIQVVFQNNRPIRFMIRYCDKGFFPTLLPLKTYITSTHEQTAINQAINLIGKVKSALIQFWIKEGGFNRSLTMNKIKIRPNKTINILKNNTNIVPFTNNILTNMNFKKFINRINAQGYANFKNLTPANQTKFLTGSNNKYIYSRGINKILDNIRSRSFN